MNDVVELRVHHRLATGDGHDRCSQGSKLIEPALNYFDRYGRGVMVILVAIAASEIAASHRDQVRQNRMTARQKGAADKAGLSQFQLNKFTFTHLGERK